MGYLDKLENKVNVVTGDGKSYDLDCIKIGLSPQHEYNASVYNFPVQDGSYVERWRPEGIRYSMEVVFHGQEHVEKAREFVVSARDRRPWRVTHPYHNILVVQPMGITTKDDFSTTMLEITMLETIVLSPLEQVNVNKNIENSINTLNDGFYLVYNNTPTVQERNALVSTIDIVVGVVNDISGSIADYASVVASVLNTARYIGNSMDKIMDEIFYVIGLPNAILMETDKRISIYKSMFDNLTSKVRVLANTNTLKNAYVGILMNIIGQQSKALAATNSTSTYVTRLQLAWYLDVYNSMANTLLNVLDNDNGFLGFTNSNVNSKDYYGVVPDIVREFMYLVALVNRSSNVIIQNGLQQRTFTLKKDMALAVLTHYLLGLTDAENIEILNKINNFTFSELIIVPKDREVVYFV